MSEPWKGDGESHLFGLPMIPETPEEEAARKRRIESRRASVLAEIATAPAYAHATVCPKCGDLEPADTAYVRDGATMSVLGVSVVAPCEIMLRGCRRCSFSWFQRPLDAEVG
jgi:hypothetical protein